MVTVVIDKEDVLAKVRLALEHLPDIVNGVAVAAGHRTLLGHAAGGADDDVWVFLKDHVGCDFNAVLHLDAGLVHLSLFVADDDAELVTAGALHGDKDLAAHFLVPVVEGYVVAPLAGHLGRPKACGTAADDHDFLLYLGGFQGPFAPGLFEADCGVLDAAQQPVDPHAADAPLVVGDAVTEVVQPSFLCLLGEERVYYKAAAHADHVGLTVGEDPLGHDRVVDAAGAEYGKLYLLADACRQRDGVTERGVHGAFNQVEVVEGGYGEVEEVEEAGRFIFLADLLDVGQVQAAGDHLVGAHADTDGEVVAHRLADRLDKHRGSA